MSILPPRLSALVVPLALALALGACHSWSRRPVASPEADRDRFLGGPVRVTRAGGPPVVLVGVRIGRDSLFGNERARPNGRVAIPLSDVRKVEKQRVDLLESAAVAVLAAAAAVTVVALFLSGAECSCIHP
jgi:hypothetical protein